MHGHQQAALIYRPLRLQCVTERMHATDKCCATVKLARNQIGAVVLYSDQVWAKGEWTAIDEDMLGGIVQCSKNLVKGLFKIVKRA